MGVKVKKMTNVSGVSLPVILKGGTTVYLPPHGIIENVNVENYFAIEKFIRAEIDLTEIAPFPEPGKKKRGKRVNLNE